MAQADDSIEPVEGKLLDGRRKKRQIVAIELPDAGEPLHERGVDAQPLDSWRDRAADVHERKDFSVRKPLAHDLERLLTAAHAGEPVVDDRQPQRPIPFCATSL